MEATTDMRTFLLARARSGKVPLATRFICSIFAAVAISDVLQIFYKGSEERLL